MVPDLEDLAYEERLKETTGNTKRRKRKQKLNYNM